jgi:hypothetical protein
MPAPKAKRPASAAKAPGAARTARKPVAAKRILRLGGAARAAARKPETAGFDGPGYHFVGFRFMCSRRHVRH